MISRSPGSSICRDDCIVRVQLLVVDCMSQQHVPYPPCGGLATYIIMKACFRVGKTRLYGLSVILP